MLEPAQLELGSGKRFTFTAAPCNEPDDVANYQPGCFALRLCVLLCQNKLGNRRSELTPRLKERVDAVEEIPRWTDQSYKYTIRSNSIQT